jgi:hypothetical protein
MFELPTPDSIEDVADWAEFQASVSGSLLSKTEAARAIEASSSQEADENFVNSVWRELSRRESAYLNPPFKVEDRTITPLTEWESIPEYVVCLVFSVYGGTEDLFKETKIFELLSAEAIRNYLSGEVKTIGWPRDDALALKDQVILVATEMNEKFIEPPAAEKKDDTVDIIAWKPFTDGRSSQLVLLTQCAAGHNWKTKLTSLRYERWCQYIHWACKPIKAFSIPKVISEKQWHDYSVDAGLLIDRLRICNLLTKGKLSAEFKKELTEWCKKQLANFGA